MKILIDEEVVMADLPWGYKAWQMYKAYCGMTNTKHAADSYGGLTEWD